MIIETMLLFAAIGAALQVWQMNGYKIGIFFENGVFQMGVVMSFITGIGGALLAVQTGLIPLTGNPITDSLLVFFTAFMVPFGIDRFITKTTKSSEDTEQPAV